ncbi:MAG: AraC family transcriptional regulator [Pseudomonadota bacterium]
MNERARERYRYRMQRVLDHIDCHLDEPLDLDRLAGVAAFSKFHFHRQFTAMFGLSVQRYVQLLRLKRASWRLAFRAGDSVTDIGLDAGYAATESFSRAFRQQFGQAPSDFRDAPEWEFWLATLGALTPARTLQMTDQFDPDTIDIVDFPATPVAVMEHRGDPARLGDTIRRFIDWRIRNGVRAATSATYTVFLTDPDAVAPEDYRIDLCAATSRAFEDRDAGIAMGLIPAGRCAVLRVTGASDDLRGAAMCLYRDWLPDSGEEARDFPLFAQRVCFFPDVPEHEAVTDLFLPLAG